MSEPLEQALARVVLERGRTLPFADLPPGTVALDGYVQGPQVDAATRRYSFDHHAGCVRHVTSATCEMVLDALRVGLDPSALELRINDLDADTVLSVWLLLRPEHCRHPQVASAWRALGRLDALGPADPGEGLWPALAWALAPMDEEAAAGRLRFLADDAYRGVLRACLERLDHWMALGAPQAGPRLQAPALEQTAAEVEVLRQAGSLVLARCSHGVAAFRDLYRAGHRAAVVQRPLADGTFEYTVGKASEFVADVDIPAVLAALRAAELSANPAQLAAYTWGGSSTIGGSPRNPDGSASRLDEGAVWAVVLGVVGG